MSCPFKKLHNASEQFIACAKKAWSCDNSTSFIMPHFILKYLARVNFIQSFYRDTILRKDITW